MHKDEAMRRTQSLIKSWMEELEKIRNWKMYPPDLINGVRRAIFKVAWGAYTIGLSVKQDD